MSAPLTGSVRKPARIAEKRCGARKTLCLAALCALAAFPAPAADAEVWLLAASPFETDAPADAAVSKLANEIPSLMLDLLSANETRRVLPDERTRRALAELQTKRQVLFGDLRKAVLGRDAVVLEDRTERALKKGIAAEERKIAAAQKQIDATLAETQALLSDKPDTGAKKKTAPAPDTDEAIRLWKGDDSALFTGHRDSEGAPFSSYRLESALAAEKIKGYITGSILAYDGYAAVSATLRVYPGGVAAGEALEVGAVADSHQVARLLANALLPLLLDTQTAKLIVAFPPEMDVGSVCVSIDAVSVQKPAEPTAVRSGVHTVSVEAAGYETETLSMQFAGDTTYRLNFALREASSDVVSVALMKAVPGVFLLNAAVQNPSPATITVNGQTVLGRFDGETGSPDYFYIPVKPNGARSWKVQPTNYDITAKIETARKIMYASYSALMIAVPVWFYTMGEYQVRQYGRTLGYLGDNPFEPTGEEKKWEQYSNYAGYGSAAIGLNFAFWLARYLYTANTVIPGRAKGEA